MKKSLLFFLLITTSRLFSQEIVINEIMAKNSNTYNPSGLFNVEYPDWIELKNTASASIDVSGYFLSDDPENPEKWIFPDGTIISGNGMLMVIASGNNTGLQTNFKLSASGEEIILSNPSKTEIQRVAYPPILNDISYGRLGTGVYSTLNMPTPDAENLDDSAFTIIDSDIDINIPSGLYDSNQIIQVTNTGEGTIYYTLDGTQPDQTSLVYTSPITITNNTALKVIAIKSASEYSIIESRSYIIGASHDLPVVLLTSDNSSFNSNNKEVINGRVEFNFIEDDGTAVISQYANFRASGRTSNFLPQLNGKVAADKIYGDGDFDYKMYPNKKNDKFEGFLLRNASQDWANTYLRDAFVARLLGQDNLTSTPFEGYRPAVLYVNAKYQGIINVREDDNRNYVKHNFGLKDNEFKTKLGKGSFVDLFGLDFNNEDDRNKFVKLVDFHEHLSLRLLLAYTTLGEWGWQIWEDLSGKTGTQFHYNFHDFDIIYGLAFDGANFTEIKTTPMIVDNLMEAEIRNYEPFKNEAIHFIAASINHIFNTERSIEILDKMQEELKSEIPAHAKAMTKLANNFSITFDSDEMPFSDLAQWEKNMDDLKTNISNLMDATIFNRIQNEYSLEDPIQVSYESSDITKGFIRIHDVKSQKESFTGTYYKNIPIHFKAEALPGYRFVRWEGDITGTDIEIKPAFSSNANITAIFEPVIPASTAIVINEVQSKNGTTIADEVGEFDDWIEIYNPSDSPANLAGYYISDKSSEPLKWKIADTDPSKTTVGAKGYLLLWADGDIDQGENHLDFKLKGTDEVILTAPDATTLVQEISFSDLETDTSYGAREDADSEFVVFDDPTPNATNNSILSVEEISFSQRNIVLYPNPAKDKITISNLPDNQIQLNWKLFDITGQNVKSGNKTEIDIQNLTNGLYILNINNTINLKVMK